jgi:hypothetical protein
MMKFALLSVTSAALLSGCAVLNGLNPAPKAPEVAMVAPLEGTVTLPDLGAGQSAAALDQTTAAEKAAATAPMAGAARELGRTTVALGSPAEQGFWLKSALVAAPGKGRVTTVSGASVAVDLQPGTGGALLSLAAFRALGLPLTDLPEVTVFAE